MVTGVDAATTVVVIVKVTDVAPAGTVTLTGTDAAADELCRVTIAPPAGAGAFRATLFRVVATPPTVETGDRTTDETATGSSVNMALLLTPPLAADIVTGVEAATGAVVMVKLTDVAPAGTVTLTGADADAAELCSVTIAPPAAAGIFKVTVFAIVVLPPVIDTGDSVTDESTGGNSVNMALLLTPS